MDDHVTARVAAAEERQADLAAAPEDRQPVVGGGWFHSPPGALTDEPSAEGRATFAFQARYTRGRSVPDGNARLHFDAGGLRLVGESFDWLVVGGDMARFRGTGVLNGEPDPVQFEIVGRDPDRLRVRIWDDDGVIYDSGDVVVGGGRVVVVKG